MSKENMDIEDRIELICDWITDLAESNFAQASNYMKKANGARCCLGVAREHCGIEDLSYWDGSLSKWTDDRDVQLSDAETELLGLNSNFGLLKGSCDIPHKSGNPDLTLHAEGLAELNDNYYTHPEIAKCIIAHPEQVFNDKRIVEGVREHFWKTYA